MLPPESIVGMGDAKDAVLCLLTDRRIRSLLIRGPPGTGKSEVARSLSVAVTGSMPATIPHNSTQDQIFGSMDMDIALSTGEIVLERGILGRAGNGIVMIDDINLMDRGTVRQIMSSISTGYVQVEREGLSSGYSCGCSLIATANSRETPLDRGTLDLFDICIDVRGSDDPYVRDEVSRANLSVGEAAWDPCLSRMVEGAKSLLPEVVLDDAMLRAVVDSCAENGVRGHRGGISTARTSMALAALDGRTCVSAEDVKRALLMCINHRRRRVVVQKEEEPERVELFGDSHMRRFIHDDRKRKPEPESQNDQSDAAATEPVGDGQAGEQDDVVLEVGEVFESIDLVEDSRGKRGLMDPHQLRRTVRDSGKEGRYVSARRYEQGSEIAIDATVRLAAPFQRSRREALGTDRVVILPSDLMGKVRERHTSCLFLFMIDNSGSLVIRSRMRAVKAAVLSILKDHYVRRDSVAVMTFNEEFVGFVQPPTRSVGCIKGVLEDIPAGRKTPLSEALVSADSTVSSYLRRHPSEWCFLVLMTDAAANIPLQEGNDPFEEAVEIAGRIRQERSEWVLVDTSSTADPKERAARLSEALRAPYYRLDDLRE